MEKTLDQKVLDILGGVEGAKLYIKDEEEGRSVKDQFDALYDLFMEVPEVDGGMPYGTMKARTGDPYQWMYNYVCKAVEAYETRT